MQACCPHCGGLLELDDPIPAPRYRRPERPAASSGGVLLLIGIVLIALVAACVLGIDEMRARRAESILDRSMDVINSAQP